MESPALNISCLAKLGARHSAGAGEDFNLRINQVYDPEQTDTGTCVHAVLLPAVFLQR
jgi:hypothetical protein